MNNDYKTYEELKEELGNNYDLFMYEINLCLLQKIDKAIEYIKEHIRIDAEYPDYMEMLLEERNELLKILGDKEQEEYTLTKDENGTTQINGEWYRVDKK